MACSNPCARETVSADPEVSIGIISHDERVCRAAYDPMHFHKGKLRKSFLKPGDLINGCLSVWRTGSTSGIDVSAIVDILRNVGPLDNALREVKSAQVDNIRNMTVPGWNGRVVSVVDDCTVDTDGGKHPSHAVIKLCTSLPNLRKEDTLFQEIHGKLALVFDDRVEWTAITT